MWAPTQTRKEDFKSAVKTKRYRQPDWNENSKEKKTLFLHHILATFGLKVEDMKLKKI